MKILLNHILYFWGAINFLFLSQGLSQSHPPTSPQPKLNNLSISIDNLQDILNKKHRSPIARTIQKSYDLLKKDKNVECLKIITPVLKNTQFQDYAFWISHLGNQNLAKFYLDKKQFLKANEFSQKSIHFLLEISKQKPYSPFIGEIIKSIAESELLIAEAQWGMKRWETATQYFEKAFVRLHRNKKLFLVNPQNIDHYAESCKNKMNPMCQAWVQRISISFPKKIKKDSIVYQVFSNLDSSVKSFRPPGKFTIGYKSTDLDLMSFDQAMKTYLEGKYKESIQLFTQFLDDYPRSVYRFRGRFWLAYAHVKMNEEEKANQLFYSLQKDSPLTYYGLVASSITKRTLEPLNVAPLSTDQELLLQPEEIHSIKRSENLIAEKAFDLASYELKEIKPREGMTNPFLMYLAMLGYQSKNYISCFQFLTELIQRGYEGVFSTYGLRMIFPIEHLELIQKYSKKNDLDPILVLSLMKQESAFTPEINSGVGAVGLMQIMPDTALGMEPKLDLKELSHVETNIRLGTLYLKKLLTKFNGNITLALIGYNAGPEVAQRWFRDQPKDQELLEFIESMRYRETREYVASIIRNYFWYSKIMYGKSELNLAYFWKPIQPIEIQGPIPSTAPIKQQIGNG